ncbi:DUF421 domain-containing protein [Nitrospira sp. KM1]|uniref:DUF421 domain-containing protein n=1 Tax=Nitrospira sp. KM1 TaxID=1936990 RepID=UPI0013A71B9D|nr:YetF domain-containing protein [Nitrospira sp. KM1]BCA55985.1 DUF421 domain-containing protein [Nitrospira sp. KM1]
MDSIIRGVTVYVFLLVIFRIAGRRTLGNMTNFDFVLVLIISEAAQNAMTGDDFSVINGMLVISTLVGLNILLSYMKLRLPRLERVIEGMPLILVKDSRPQRELMKKARVDEEDILSSARENYGLGTMEQIRYAILETNGSISIIPKAG